MASYGMIVSPKFKIYPKTEGILCSVAQNTFPAGFFLDIVSVSPRSLGRVYPRNSSQNSVAQNTFLDTVLVSSRSLGEVYPRNSSQNSVAQNTFFLEGAVEVAKN